MSVSPISAAPSVRFALLARSLADRCRAMGVEAPSFRSPPRVAGCTRTIRRSSAGAVVSVVVRGRPASAVAADLIEGVIATNRLSGAEASRVRDDLWFTVEAVGAEADDAAGASMAA